MKLLPITLVPVTPTTTSIKYTDNEFINKYLNNFDWNQILATLTTKIFNIILISILFLIIAKVGKRLITHFFKKYQQKLDKKDESNILTDTPLDVIKRRNKTLYYLLQNTYYYIIIFFWLYSILSIIGIPVGTLIAGAGIFSLAIGLGAQGFVSDIVSGFFILFEHQIDVGDHVIINDINGFVSAVGLRTTKITCADGTLNFIPNRNITTISNLSRGNLLALVNIKITPESPIQKIEEIIDNVNAEKDSENPDVVGKPFIFGTIYLPNGELAIEVCITTKNKSTIKIQAEYLSAYITAIQKAGIKLPAYPMTFNNNDK